MEFTVQANTAYTTTEAGGLGAMRATEMETLIQYMDLKSFFKLKIVCKGLRSSLTNEENMGSEGSHRASVKKLVLHKFFKREAFHMFCPMLFDPMNNPFV
jgi:hypothetical protein